MRIEVEMGTTYCGCPSETFELDCNDRNDYESHRFSTDILNAIWNGEAAHYFLDIGSPSIDAPDESIATRCEECDDCIIKTDCTWYCERYNVECKDVQRCKYIESED